MQRLTASWFAGRARARHRQEPELVEPLEVLADRPETKQRKHITALPDHGCQLVESHGQPLRNVAHRSAAHPWMRVITPRDPPHDTRGTYTSCATIRAVQISGLTAYAHVADVQRSLEFYAHFGLEVRNSYESGSWTPDVQGLHDGVASVGVEVGEVQHRFYMPAGEFRAVDPDGYVLLVGQLDDAN